jgi:hypothetical protein
MDVRAIQEEINSLKLQIVAKEKEIQDAISAGNDKREESLRAEKTALIAKETALINRLPVASTGESVALWVAFYYLFEGSHDVSVKPSRITSKQLSFGDKLRTRNDTEHCEMCNEFSRGLLQSCHIVDVQYQAQYKEHIRASKNSKMPLSVNDGQNGLLLCVSCHTFYDKIVKRGRYTGRCIQIKPDGQIELYGDAKESNYKQLHGKFVPWHAQIGINTWYPTAELLQYAYDLKTVGAGKRIREEIEESESSTDEDLSQPYVTASGRTVKRKTDKH